MPKFGTKSLEKLSTCHPDLKLLFEVDVREFDCTVLCGQRNEVEQNESIRNKRTNVRWPDGKHNSTPSDGIVGEAGAFLSSHGEGGTRACFL